jgi:hypothetical protein
VITRPITTLIAVSSDISSNEQNLERTMHQQLTACRRWTQCASCRGGGLDPPAIGANPLADCTSDPSGVEETEEREGKRGKGRIPYFDPPCSFLTTGTLAGLMSQCSPNVSSLFNKCAQEKHKRFRQFNFVASQIARQRINRKKTKSIQI